MCLADTNNIFFFDFTDRDSKSRSPALEERTITIFHRCGSVYPITTISRPWGEDDYHIPPMWFCLHYHHDLPPLWRGRLPLHHRCGSVYTITTISRPCGEDDYHYTTDVVLFTLSPRSPALVERTITITPQMWFCLYYHHDLPPLWRGRLSLHHRCGSVYIITTISRPCGEDDYHYTTDVVLFTLSPRSPALEERTLIITPQMWFCLHYHHDLPPLWRGRLPLHHRCGSVDIITTISRPWGEDDYHYTTDVVLFTLSPRSPDLVERKIIITPQMWFCLHYHHDLPPLWRGRLPLHHRCGSVYIITTISRPWGEDDYHYTTDVVLFTLSPRSPALEERTITITPQMWFCLHYHHDLPPLRRGRLPLHHGCGSVYNITTISRPCGEDDYHYTTDVVLFTLSPRSPALVERTITITPQMWFCLHYHHDLPPLRRRRLPLHHRCGSVYIITTISRPWGEDDYHYTTDVVLFTLSPRSPALVERTITITPQMWFCLHYHHNLPPLWGRRLPLHHRCGSVYTITTISRPWGEDDYHYTTDVVLFTLSPRSPALVERTITITPQMWFCLHYHHDLPPLRRGRLPLHHRCGSVYTITTISRPWGEDDYHYTTDVVLFTLSPRSPALVERTITITPQMWFCLHYHHDLPPLRRGRLPLHHRCGSVYTICRLIADWYSIIFNFYIC